MNQVELNHFEEKQNSKFKRLGDVLITIFSKPSGMIGFSIVTLHIIIAIISPLIVPYDYKEINSLIMFLGGGVSGLVNGAAGVGGPPFVSVLIARNDNAEITRSNIIITMGCMALLTTLTQFFYRPYALGLHISSISSY